MSEQEAIGNEHSPVRVAPALAEDQFAGIDQAAKQADKPEAYWIAEIFNKRAEEEGLAGEARAAWRLLTELMRMHFRPEDAKDPFKPSMTWSKGARTLIPGDLQENEIAFLETVLEKIADCEVRAWVADILWLATRNAARGRDAIGDYMASAERLEDPQHCPPAIERLQRAARLARTLGKDEPLLQAVLEKMLEQIRRYKGRDPLFFTCQLAELLYEFRYGDVAELARYTLAGAEAARAEPDFNRARQYYETSAKLLRRADDSQGVSRTRLAIAETFVEEAELDEQSGDFMAAQVAWTSAILAFRKAPGNAARVAQLQLRLEAVSGRMHEQMQGFQHRVDFTEKINAATASVQRSQPVRGDAGLRGAAVRQGRGAAASDTEADERLPTSGSHADENF